MGQGREYRRQRKRAREGRQWRRTRRFNVHHIENRVNGGLAVQANLLRMDTARHKAWHLLFHNLSFEEVERLLRRVREWKKNKPGASISRPRLVLVWDEDERRRA